jgi:branched-chain amino acid transport system permease protein
MIEYLANLLVLISIYWILATSLDLAIGYCGIFSITQAAFYGLGAYASALLSLNLPIAFPFNLFGSVVITSILAYLSSHILLRLRQDYLALATLAFGIIIQECFRNAEFLTGGSRGLSGIPSIQIFGFSFQDPVSAAALTLVISGIVVFCLHQLEQSQFGIFLRGIDNDEVSLQALGTNTFQLKITAFNIAAIGAAIAGSLYAHYSMSLDPNRFSIDESFLIISAIALGGKRSLRGTVFGVFMLILIPEALRFMPISSYQLAALRDVIFSIILISVLILRPQGLWPSQIKPLTTKFFPSTSTKSPPLPPPNQEVLLDIQHLYRKINSEFSINIQNIQLATGQIYGIVGANGAGKSMFFNVLTGIIPADRAIASFAGKPIRQFTPDRISNLGIARTFQSVRLHPELTVLENFSLINPAKIPTLIRNAFFPKNKLPHPDINYARELLNNINLTEYENQPASDLSFGQQKAIEIIRVISRRPRLLLLDEPISGLSLQVRPILIAELRRLQQTGVTIVIIEHDQEFLTSICDHWIQIKDGSITHQTDSPPHA